MNYQIVISGVGGQGVLLVTRLLAQACMAQGHPVLTSETHGMAQRGGTVISHLKTGTFSSPLIRPGKADLLISLKSETYEQHKDYLAPGGKAVVNAVNGELEASDAVCLDAVQFLTSYGGARSTNLFMLGAALAVVPVCPTDLVKDQVRLKLTRLSSQAREQAVLVLERGYDAVREG